VGDDRHFLHPVEVEAAAFGLGELGIRHALLMAAEDGDAAARHGRKEGGIQPGPVDVVGRIERVARPEDAVDPFDGHGVFLENEGG
jgi:hypothetical protein